MLEYQGYCKRRCDIMIKYDTLYVCPVCQSEHGADEWNESTEEDFGGVIMPIEVSPPEHFFSCPTCGSESEVDDIEEI
jgi:RNA polymerase subunit RPABC4/transcription elongation factor Spt4